MALADHPAGGVQEPVGGLGADMHRVAGLQDMQFLHHFQQDIGNLAHAVRTVGLDAADIDVGEIIVGAALAGRDSYFGWRRLIVHLDPETTDQLFRLVAGQGARGDLALIERREMLVEMAGVHRIPAVQLGDGSQMHEPIHLDGFTEGPRRMRRHPAAGFGDF